MGATFPGEQVLVLPSRTYKRNETDITPKSGSYQEKVIEVQSGEKDGFCGGCSGVIEEAFCSGSSV